jgi:hypothetical protein
MGQEIAYCSVCGTRLRSVDFEKGQAFRHEHLNYCKNCAPAGLQAAAHAPPSKSSPALLPKSSSRMAIVPAEPQPFPLGIVAAIVVIVLLAGGLLLLRRSSPEPTPVGTPAPTPASTPLATSPPVKVDPTPAPTPAPPTPGEDARKLKERIASDLALLDQELGPLVAREAFQNGLALLGSARGRHPGPDWSGPIDERERRIGEDVEKLFAGLRADAVAAQSAGALDKVREIGARVAKWELPAYVAQLEQSLAATPKPPDPDVAGYRATWAAAWTLAADRDPAGAKLLEDAARGLKSPALKAEAETDVKLFRQAAQAAQEGLWLLAATPKGESLTLKALGETGAPRAVTGIVKRIDKGRIEIGSDVLLLGEVLSGSLIATLRARSPKIGDYDPAALELACLLENPEDAKAPGTTPALPAKYWDYVPAIDSAKLKREADARKLFYQAERDAAGFETAADAARAYASLLGDSSASAFVCRNRAGIAARPDLAKEFVFLAADMKVGGSLKPASNDKLRSFWKSSAAGENGVELGFSTLPGAEYRGWVYVGGCCLESLAFTSDDAPVKQSLATSPRSHAEHGAKANVRWGWVPLPKVASKKIRLVARGSAFSIAYAFVSAIRQAPPKDAELAEVEKLRGETAARPAPPPTPGELQIATDFSSEGAIHPNFDIKRGDLPVTFSGLVEIGFAPTQASGERSSFVSYQQVWAPCRLTLDVEFTRRDPKAVLGLRLPLYEGENLAGAIYADAGTKYTLSVQGGASTACDAPPAGQRERWTLEIQDGIAIWAVNGKELLRLPGIRSDLGFKAQVVASGAAGVDPECKARLRQLSVERLPKH